MRRAQDEEVLSIDSTILAEIIRRQARKLLITGLGVFVLLLAYLLLILPQSYTSTISLSVQKAGDNNPSLVGLLGNTGSKKHVGLLRSRLLAERVIKNVERHDRLSIPTLCHLNLEEAIDMLINNLNVDDNPGDGLVYLAVTLPGPPWLSPSSSSRKAKVRKAVQAAANAYYRELTYYYIKDDNDEDYVQQRAAEKQERMANDEYNKAFDNLRRYIRGTRLTGGISEEAAKGLTTLYGEAGRVEAQIAGANAQIQALQRLTSSQLVDLNSLPGEDPLLGEARRSVKMATQELQTLQIQLANDHPRVVAARERLRLAMARLDREIQSIRKGHTSELARARAEVENLQSQDEVLRQQIAREEDKLKIGRVEMTELENLRSEMTLRLEGWKAAKTLAVTLTMQTTSAQSKVKIVDKADLPRRGQPGLGKAIILSLLAAGMVLGFWISVDYARWLRHPLSERVVNRALVGD